MNAVVVSALYIYPIKSCAGIELQGVRFDDRGPQFDRRFMVISSDGQMVTQRTAPQLCLARPALSPTALTVRAPDLPNLTLPLESGGRRTSAVVWGHETEALDQGDQAAAWFSRLLDQPVRLVRWADDQIRPTSKRHTDRDGQIGFADGYPILLLSEASLNDLNRRLAAPLPMNRFRPNVVVRGCGAFAEDSWREIDLGALTCSVVKACVRCAITTVDQASAAVGREPLATLAGYRRKDNRVVFGQNCIHHGRGHIRVGDPVTISL